MSQHRAKAVVYALVAALIGVHPPAYGQVPGAQAGGTAEIVGAVSTGVAFDIARQVLTSVFVTGRVGDTVSIFSPTVIQSHDGLAPATQIATLGEVTILSRGTVSVNLQQIRNSPDTSPDYGNSVLVILAQFN